MFCSQNFRRSISKIIIFSFTSYQKITIFFSWFFEYWNKNTAENCVEDKLPNSMRAGQYRIYVYARLQGYYDPIFFDVYSLPFSFTSRTSHLYLTNIYRKSRIMS